MNHASRVTAKEFRSTKESPLSPAPANELVPVNRRLIPVTQWNKHHVWPPIGGLRHLIFHRNSNGFSHCLRKVGRKVLIDETRFLSPNVDRTSVQIFQFVLLARTTET